MSLLPSASALLLALASIAGAQTLPNGAPCWEVDYGTALNLGDDGVSAPVPIGFAFPRPGAGGTTDSVVVSSNGFVWLDAGQTASDPTPSVATFLSGAPRIAAAWMDLDPSTFGDAHANSSSSTRFVVTWNTLTRTDGRPARVQLQLYPDGSFSIYHLRLENELPDRTGPIVGVTPGGGAMDPGESDLSTLVTPTALGSTIYEQFDPGTGDLRDLTGLGLLFTRNGNGDYTVSQPGCAALPFGEGVTSGTGCPTATRAMLWEEFTGGADANDLSGVTLTYRAFGQGFVVERAPSVPWVSDFGTPIPLADDELSAPVPLGFTANYFGVPLSAIEIGSNGFINLETGANSDVSISPGSLAAGPMRLAVLAQDLDPSAGGSVHVRNVGGTNAYTLVTYNRVSLAASPTQSILVQARFRETGDIFVTYGGGSAPTGLLGISRGGGLALPPETDVSTTPPFYLDGQVIPPLRHDGFPWPAIGESYELRATDLAPGTLAVIAHIGLTSASVDLTGIGMPGCIIQVLPILDIVPMTLISTSVASAVLGIPVETRLVGGVVRTQAIELSPGVNALDLGVSNALEIRVGY